MAFRKHLFRIYLIQLFSLITFTLDISRLAEMLRKMV